MHPVFTSKKIADEIKVTESKPSLINEQCVVYEYKCDLCDAGYVGYTCGHLFQRINEHKYSVIAGHTQSEEQRSSWSIYNPQEMPSEAESFNLWNALHEKQKKKKKQH